MKTATSRVASSPPPRRGRPSCGPALLVLVLWAAPEGLTSPADPRLGGRNSDIFYLCLEIWPESQESSFVSLDGASIVYVT